MMLRDDLLILLDGLTEPPLYFPTSNIEIEQSGKLDFVGLDIDESYTVRVEGSQAVYTLFTPHSITKTSPFEGLSRVLKKAILDVLYLLLRRSLYDVIRFRSIEKHQRGSSLVALLLQLSDSSTDVLITKRILRLIGVVSLVSITVNEMKNFLERLKNPTVLSLALLESFKMMLKKEEASSKEELTSFFSFGGVNSGLFSHSSPVFVNKELQMSMWFRIEAFNASSPKVHLVWCANEEHQCLDVFIEERTLAFYTDLQGIATLVKVKDTALQVGTWYYLHVSFMRHRWSLFNRSQLTINLDNKVIYQDFVKLPKFHSRREEEGVTPKLAIGHNMNGQIGNVYFFSESMLASTMEAFSGSSTGKFKEGNRMNSSFDLLGLTSLSSSSTLMNPKMLTVFHPGRVAKGHALDVHGGRHALMGAITYAWNVRTPRDVLVSLGGIACLLPLFPRLLIENEEVVFEDAVSDAPDAHTTQNTGLGISLADIFSDPECSLYLGPRSIDDLAAEHKELEADGCIGLLMSVLARCLRGHAAYQQELGRIKGIGMIEYALSNTPDEIIFRESSTTAMALLTLQAALADSPELESFFVKRLLCNYSIWCKASLSLQQSIMAIVLAATRGRPDQYLRSLGVEWLFEQLNYFFLSSIEDSSAHSTEELKQTMSDIPIPLPPQQQQLSVKSERPAPPQQQQEEDMLVDLPQFRRSASDSVSSGVTLRRKRSNDLSARSRNGTPKGVSSAAADVFFPPPLSSYKSFNRALTRQITTSSNFEDSESESSEKTKQSSRRSSMILSAKYKEEIVLTAHRMRMRNSLYSAIHILVEQGLTVKEVIPFFTFMESCSDTAVLSEVAQLLLRLLVDNHLLLPNLLMEACGGLDGFSAFIINILVDSPRETVRTAGIRILTHFYSRLDSVQSLTSSIDQMITRRLSRDTMLYSAMRNLTYHPGIDVLHKKGGLQTIQHLLLSKYIKQSSQTTYYSLLEMLVSRPGAYGPSSLATVGDTSDPQLGEYQVPMYKLSQSSTNDDTGIYMEPTVLPVYLNLAMELSYQDKVFVDLMVILKSAPVNREVFTLYVAWNARLFSMISSLDVYSDGTVHYVSTEDVHWLLMKAFTNEVTRPMIGKTNSKLSIDTKLSAEGHDENSVYEFGIEIYASLLIHCLEKKGGCKEVDRMLRLSLDLEHGRAIAQGILSHLVNNLTFIMRSKYRELQKLAKSSSKSERTQAVDRIENLLLLMISVSSFVLDDLDASFASLPERCKRPPKWITVDNSKLSAHDDRHESRPPPNVELHALGKDHSLEHGRLVITLQVTRLFDVLFWPTEGDGSLRNIEMLKYHKYSKRTATNKSSQYMTLLTSMLRISVGFLESFFPFGDIADLNFRRIVALITASHNVYPLKGPMGVDDWFIVIFALVARNVALLRDSLKPVFHHLGMQPLDATTARNAEGDYVFESKFHTSQLEIDEEAYERIVKDKGVSLHTEGVFNTEFGSKVLRTIKSLIHIISIMYELNFYLIADSLGPGVVEALSMLMNTIKGFSSRSGDDEDEFDMDANNPFHERDGGTPSKRRSSLQSLDSSILNEVSHLNRESTGSDLSDDESFVSIQWSATSETAGGGLTPRLCEEVSIHGIVEIFKYVRDPFFMYNLFEEKVVLDSLATIRSLERDGAQLFNDQLKQSNLMTDYQLSNMSMKFTELTTETYPNWKELQISNRAMEASLAKSVAMNWQRNLRGFDSEWSPWFFPQSAYTYRLSAHRDQSLRRMLFVKNHLNVSYSDFCYQPHKRRDGEDAAADEDSSKTLGLLSVPYVKPPTSALMSKLTSWGDEEELKFDETAPLDFEKSPLWMSAFERSGDEKEVFAAEAVLVELEHSISGTLFLTNKNLYFHPKKLVEGSIVNSRGRALQTRSWLLECLVEMFSRRYMLQNCGIELFFSETPGVFVAFSSLKVLQRFFYLVRKQNVPGLTTPGTLNPKGACERMNITDLWRRRLISNFTYLMKLNTLAGRSFNDLTQYPVFPWIIADYTSKVLDLENPATFRDLSKPIGALNEARLSEVMERYHNFEDPDIPKFMYGSLYSSAGVVLHYLVRQEPFTKMAISMQGGKFDCPDRLFFDLSSTWEGINNSISDVKELIPELFFAPEYLTNSNKLPLGDLQDGTHVDDVRLPPWANNDPIQFIRMHREALECDYVSDNLHKWVDLIFGYKQTGEPAVEAHNLFYYLTYENAVDIHKITDPILREATISQVTNFGQTPSKLFDKPHPKRHPRKESLVSICSDIASTGSLRAFLPPKQQLSAGMGAVLNIRCSPSWVVLYYADMTVSYYKWNAMPDGTNPFQIKSDRIKKSPYVALSVNSVSVDTLAPYVPPPVLPSSDEDTKESDSAPVESPSAVNQGVVDFLLHIESLIEFVVRKTNARSNRYDHSYFGAKNVDMYLQEGGSSRVVTCGYWDQHIRVHSLDSAREVASAAGHIGAVTCVMLGSKGNMLVSGGVDGTCRVWLFDKGISLVNSFYDDIQTFSGPDPSSAEGAMICVHVLCGHKATVSSLYYSQEQDLVLSGSEEGTLCLHTAHRGEYVRTLLDGSHAVSIDAVFVTWHGYLIAHSWKDLKLQSFWVNGQVIAKVQMFARIECFAMNAQGDVLVCGQNDGSVLLSNVHTLAPIRTIDLMQHGSIKCLSFSDDRQFLFIGSEDGNFNIALDPESRWRVMQAALERSPLLGLST